MHTVTIEVTQEDIDSGARHSTESCPLALALSRATGTLVRVVNEIVFIDRPDLNITTGYRMGLYQKRFVHRFDKGRKVRPFWFELSTPDTREEFTTLGSFSDSPKALTR